MFNSVDQCYNIPNPFGKESGTISVFSNDGGAKGIEIIVDRLLIIGCAALAVSLLMAALRR